jgi:hypothetical protein
LNRSEASVYRLLTAHDLPFFIVSSVAGKLG